MEDTVTKLKSKSSFLKHETSEIEALSFNDSINEDLQIFKSDMHIMKSKDEEKALFSELISNINTLDTTHVTSGIIKPIKQTLFTKNLTVVKFSPCGSQILVGLSNGIIKVSSTNSGQELYNLDIGSKALCSDFCFVPTNNESKIIVACYSNGNITLWDYEVEYEQPILQWQESDRNILMVNHTLCCSVSGDGIRVATGGDGSIIRVYNIITGTELKKLFPAAIPNVQYNNTMRVTSVLYDVRGMHKDTDNIYTHILFSAGWDNRIYVWDDRHCNPLWFFEGSHVCGTQGLDFSPENMEILSSSWDRETAIIRIWKFSDVLVQDPVENELLVDFNNPILKYSQNSNFLPAKAYVSKYICGGKYILYAGLYGNGLKILDRKTLKCVGSIRNLQVGIFTAAFANSTADIGKIKIAIVTGNSLILVEVPKI